jgi:hypothetical protein
MPSALDEVVRIVIPPMTTSWFVKVRVEEPRRFAVRTPDTMTFSACDACSGTGAGCEPTPLLDHGFSVMWSGDYVLHFQPAVLDPSDPKRSLPVAAELVAY